MGFLALAAVSAGLPALFSLSDGTARALHALEWAIIGVFALEYGVHLAAAEHKRRYVRDPWRILDAFMAKGWLR